MKYFAKSFQSLDEFAEYLDRVEVQPMFTERQASRDGSKKFTSTESFEESCDLLRFGDRDNARRLGAGVAVPGAVTESIRARRVRCVAGSSVNVAAALSGRPKSMYKIVRKSVPAKVVNLAYNMDIDFRVPTSEIVRVSAKIANAVLSLEKAGYQVNLYACCVSYANEEAAGCFVRVKSAGQYIDITRLAYCLVNPSFLRRSVFRFIETLPGLTDRAWSRTYGRCGLDRAKVADLAASAGLASCRVVSFYDIRHLDEAGVAALALS